MSATATYKTDVTYVSDGRNAMWHLPFPFLHPSDIGVRLIDKLGLYHDIETPDNFIAYWDYIVCVVPVGWRINIRLIPPLSKVLAGLAVRPQTKQILDRHKIKAIGPDQYASESDDGSYDELAEDVEGIDTDVPFPDLQNDRTVLIEGNPADVTPDCDAQKVCSASKTCSCGCDSGPTYQGIGCPCTTQCNCEDARKMRPTDFNPHWVPGGLE